MLVLILSILLQFSALMLILPAAVLLLQAGAAILLRDRPLILSVDRPSIAVLIPAHDEEQNIERTVSEIKRDLLSADRILVVADNCFDKTAKLAAHAGADVLVRNDPLRRGKGFALAAGLKHLTSTNPEIVIFVDADCQFDSGGLEPLARASAAANAPVQCLYVTAACENGPARSRLAEFAWRIKNDLRPSGYARLGLPCHLLGSGIAMPFGLVEPGLFSTDHVTEDLLLGLELAVRGHKPRFFRGSRVRSCFPNSERGQTQQKQRWVHGHLELISSHLPRLLYRALRHRDLGLLAFAADLAVPPLSLLALADMTLAILAMTCRAAGGGAFPVALPALASSVFALFLMTAWYTCGRDLIGARELKQLPRHFAAVTLFAAILARGRRSEWTRTDRL